MKYENRTIPEGINISSEHPLKEFIILGLGVGLATFFLVVLLSISASLIAQFIPFELEKKLSQVSFSINNEESQFKATENNLKAQSYLQSLANSLALAQNLPPEMNVTVHYIQGDTMNAFATLGGNIVLYSALVQSLPNENALSMLVAHEIAHIKQRAPIISLGRGITVSLALSALVGAGDSAFSQSLVGNVSLLTSLSFSRSQEESADLEALKTLQTYYGHTEGAAHLFEALQKQHSENNPIKLFSTHPLTQDRLNNITSFNGPHSKTINLIMLPDFLKQTKE